MSPLMLLPKREESRFDAVVVDRSRFVGKVTKVYDPEAVERTERFIVQFVWRRPSVTEAVWPGGLPRGWAKILVD